MHAGQMTAPQSVWKALPWLMTLILLASLTFFSMSPQFIPKNHQRQHKRLFGSAAARPRCRIEALGSVQQFYDYFRNLEYQCKDLRVFGSRPFRTDGIKYVCLDERFALKPHNCTVVSFGINYEWDFEDDMDEFGCKVHAFDPTMKQLDHQRSPRVFFYKLGIGSVKGKRKIGMNKDIDFFEVDRYENILRRLGLQDSRIDYLKLDVELSELEFLQDVLRSTPHLLRNVAQMGIEIHHGYQGEGVDDKPPLAGALSPTSTFPLFWSHFQELRCHGFRLLHVRSNGPWHEVVWGRSDHWLLGSEEVG
ncbi:probable methyltransferase-like protein 24 [Panulirus ornatus]|uniref:probable methyltransferase-like protein 24 n=1 Tax=Panulirus ornatus TaxID=150431 RepID=UPI003A85471B